MSELRNSDVVIASADVAATRGRVAIGLVGGGTAGAALLDLLLEWPDGVVAVVIDRRPDTAGLRTASALGIPTASHHLAVFDHAIDVVLESTGHPDVLEDLLRVKPAHVEVVGASSLRFFSTLLQSLSAEATRRQRQAEELARVAQVVTASLDLADVFERVVHAATSLLPEATARIWVAEGDRLRLRSNTGNDSVPQDEFAFGEGLTGRVGLSRRPLIVEDMQSDPRTVNHAWASRQGHLSFAGIPLMVGDRLVGVLTLVSRHRHPFNSGEVQVLTTFGSQAAIAIENARLFEESRGRQARLEGLTQITAELTKLQPLESLLARIAAACGRLTNTDSIGLRLVEGDELVMVGRSGEAESIMPTDRLKLGESLSGLVAASGSPLLVQNPADDPRVLPAHREAVRAAGHRAYLGVPVKIGDRVLGVLSVSTHRAEGFSREDVAITTAFASQAAIALENARLFAEAERRRSVAVQLADLGQVISRSLESEVVGRKIVEGLRALLGAQTSVLYRVDPLSSDLRAHAVVGEVGALTVLAAGTGLAGLAVRDRKPMVSSNAASDPRVTLPPVDRGEIERNLARAVLVVPLLVEDVVVGVLGVGDREGRRYSDDDVQLAQVFAGQAVLALENARLYEQARTQLERTQTLLTIGQTVGAALDLTETLRRVAAAMRQALNADLVGAYLADDNEHTLRPIAGSRIPKALLEPLRNTVPLEGHPFVEEAWEGRRTAWSKDAAADPRIDRALSRLFPGSSVAFVPMVGKDVVIGGLFVVWTRERPTLTVDERMLAEGICQQAALAVGDARLYEEVRCTLEELRRTQEQLLQSQKMEAIGRLAGGIAHDFNNLLTIIIGRSDLLCRDPRAGDTVRRSLEAIQTAAGTAASLTRQLLAFSRKQVLEPRVLDLNAIVASTNKMLHRLIGEDIALGTVLEPDLGRVKADPGQIEQILMNLAVNARDAMPTGGRLTIVTANVDLDAAVVRDDADARPGPHVALTVSDTGIGMTPDTLAHIFEPFFTTKDIGRGTGLGLATVYGIVKQSGGWMSVSSAPGEGSTFTIYLPRVPDVAAAVPPGSLLDTRRGSETILLVEDESAVRSFSREVLEEGGYMVLEASNGTDALAISQLHPGDIHLLLTDIVMPRMNGRDLATRLAVGRPGMAVLYMSGYPDGLVMHDGAARPDAALVQKPMAPDVLLRKVRDALDGR